MKIYLAGKMDETYGAWRDAILGKFYDHEIRQERPRWELVQRLGDSYVSDDLDVMPWPDAENRHVLGLHDYVGPYRVTFAPTPRVKACGYFHGSTARGQHGMMDDADRRYIYKSCVAAVARADMVFAYLNRPDCFGTIAEIAFAQSFGKYVHIVVTEDAEWDWGDYWFVEELANAITTIRSDEFSQQGDVQNHQIERVFRDALVAWTAYRRPAAPLALVPTQPGRVTIHDAVQSFSQIANWSADPRVRSEAQRMLKRITG